MVNSTYMIFQPAIMSGDGRPGLGGMSSPRQMLALVCIQSTWNMCTFSAHPRNIDYIVLECQEIGWVKRGRGDYAAHKQKDCQIANQAEQKSCPESYCCFQKGWHSCAALTFWPLEPHNVNLLFWAQITSKLHNFCCDLLHLMMHRAGKPKECQKTT